MKLHVLNPVALELEKAGKKNALVPRLPKLEGKVIGLFWNVKAGGDAALKRAGELLKARYPGLETKSYVGAIGTSLRYLSKDQIKQVTQECAAVIGSTAD